MTQAAREGAARLAGRLAGVRWESRAVDLVVLAGLLVLAAALRLPDLATRGPWDTDQGEQMLAIRSIATGQLTLLGPPTSTGGLHHGPVFYYLGALFALPTGGDDPTAVTFGIALGGIATVGFVWWLARAAGAGPVGAAVAGLLAAVSSQMIDASVRLWNPAFVAPGAALALAAALEARRRQDPRWWLLAAVGFVVAAQSHVLAWILAVPVGILAIAELRRMGRRAVPWLAGAGVLVGLTFVPVAINELTTGFSEIAALLRARAGVATDEAPPWLIRAIFVPIRILAVPLVRDVVASLVATTAAVGLVVGAVALASRRSEAAAPVARMLAVGLAVGIVGLVIGAPWLSTVTPLYVDHYHLALDPIVFALLGLGAGVLWRRAAGRAVVAVVAGGIVAWNLVAVPLPPVDADGGWPAGLAAGQRVVDDLGGAPTVVIGVPKFKKTTAVNYPMTTLGNPPANAGLDPALGGDAAAGVKAGATRVVVLCDRLFEDVVGQACLGPAEATRLAEVGIAAGRMLDRFEAAPGRWISIYEIAGP